MHDARYTARIASLMKELDENGDGVVSHGEFCKGCHEHFGSTLTSAERERLWKEMDIDHSGLLTMSELRAYFGLLPLSQAFQSPVQGRGRPQKGSATGDVALPPKAAAPVVMSSVKPGPHAAGLREASTKAADWAQLDEEHSFFYSADVEDKLQALTNRSVHTWHRPTAPPALGCTAPLPHQPWAAPPHCPTSPGPHQPWAAPQADARG